MRSEVSYLNSVSYKLGVIIVPISQSAVTDKMNENTHTHLLEYCPLFASTT